MLKSNDIKVFNDYPRTSKISMASKFAFDPSNISLTKLSQSKKNAIRGKAFRDIKINFGIDLVNTDIVKPVTYKIIELGVEDVKEIPHTRESFNENFVTGVIVGLYKDVSLID